MTHMIRQLPVRCDGLITAVVRGGIRLISPAFASHLTLAQVRINCPPLRLARECVLS
jgi:hypothetical protein